MVYNIVLISAISQRESAIDIYTYGLPRWLSGKESAYNAEDAGLIYGLGRSPGGGNGSPLQCSCLENPMDRRAWWGYMGLQRVGHDLLTEHIDIYPFSLEPLSHLPPHPTPLDCNRAPDLSSLHHIVNSHWLSNFTYGNVYVSKLLSQFIHVYMSKSKVLRTEFL